MSSKLRKLKVACDSPFKQTRISDFFMEVKVSNAQEKSQQTSTKKQPRKSLPFPLFVDRDSDIDMSQTNIASSCGNAIPSSRNHSSGSSNGDETSENTITLGNKNPAVILENVVITSSSANSNKHDDLKRKTNDQTDDDASPRKQANVPKNSETTNAQSPTKWTFHIGNLFILQESNRQEHHNCSGTAVGCDGNLSTPKKVISKFSPTDPIPSTSSAKNASPLKSSGKRMNLSPSSPKSKKSLVFSPVKAGTNGETPEKPKSPAKVPPDSVIKTKDEKFNLKQLECMRERFQDTLNSINKRLLKDTETGVIEEFLKMEVNHQYFLIKLFFYLPKWYNLMDFCKKIYLDQKMSSKQINQMYEALKAKEWIQTDVNELDVDILLEMSSGPDLKSVCKDYKLGTTSTKKEILIKALKDNCRRQPNLSTENTPKDVLKKRIINRLGIRMKLDDKIRAAFHKTYFAQVFTQRDYIDPQIFFSDTIYFGVSYPNFLIEQYPVFTNSKQFSRYFDAVVLRKNYFDNASKKPEDMKILADGVFLKLKKILPDEKWPDYFEEHLRQFSAEYQYISILNSASKKLVAKYHDSVESWLRFLIKYYKEHHALGYWYKQLAHIHAYYLKDNQKAAEIALEAFEFNKRENCFDSVQLHELSNFAMKIWSNRRNEITKLSRDKLSVLAESPVKSDNFIKTTISGRTDRNSKVGKRIYSYTDENGDQVYGSVEALAINHYKSEENYKGIHCEGRLLNIFFVLLFWDIIYESDIAHTFISKYQEAPLDMFSRNFYKNRKECIDKRLKEISTEWSQEKIESVIKKNWDEHSHEECLAKLESVTKNPEELLEMFRSIERKVLAKVFERLVINYKRYRSGLPDLFLWKPNTTEYKLVEVKGEGDKLSLNQILWIQYLMDNEACVEVCHVTGVGAKKSNL